MQACTLPTRSAVASIAAAALRTHGARPGPSIVHGHGVVPNLAAKTLDATRTTSSRGELELHAF